MEQLGMELPLQNLLNFLTDYCISVFTTENQMSVYQIHGETTIPFQYDGRRILLYRDKENEQGYDYSKQERSGLTKRDSFSQNMRIPKQNWEDIQVDYIYYPLKEKYHL